MTLPEQLLTVLPPATARAWERIAPLAPSSSYLVGGTALAVHLYHRESRDLDFFLSAPTDLYTLADRLAGIGSFVASRLTDTTLNGVLDDAKVQFLLADNQRILEPLTEVAGIAVAGIGDLLATKLKVLADRGELRDYFDIMVVEQQAGRTVEEGLTLFVARYRPAVPDDAITVIVRALGSFVDVNDDPELPISRQEIERYWRRRQKEIVGHLNRYGP
jgi:hypothetical protein